MSYVFWFLAASNALFAALYGGRYCCGDETAEIPTSTMFFLYITIAALFAGSALR